MIVQLQMLISLLLKEFQLYLKHLSFKEFEELQAYFTEAIGSIMEFYHEKSTCL